MRNRSMSSPKPAPICIGFGRAVPVRDRHRPCTGPCPHGGQAGQAVRRHSRLFVEKFKSRTEYGALPPVVLATLRKRMVALSAEIAEGLVFANGSRAHMTESLGALPAVKRSDPDFFIGNRIRTCISDDVDEAKAVLRKTMAHYWAMPNYRNYWKEAGYSTRLTRRKRRSPGDAPMSYPNI